MKVVYTTGAFDLLHVGHLNRLRDARSLGDKLIVGIMSDEFIRRSKNREPIIPERDRAELLMALSCVDEVVIVPDHTADHDFLTRHGVTTRVVGPEYGWAEGHRQALLYMEEHGIKVIRASRMPGISTTEIVRKIRE